MNQALQLPRATAATMSQHDRSTHQSRHTSPTTLDTGGCTFPCASRTPKLARVHRYLIEYHSRQGRQTAATDLPDCLDDRLYSEVDA